MTQHISALLNGRLSILARDDEGAAGIEYIILATLVAVVLATAAPGIITTVTGTVTTIAKAL